MKYRPQLEAGAVNLNFKHQIPVWNIPIIYHGAKVRKIRLFG